MKITTINNDKGSGPLSLIITVGIMLLIGWFLYSRLLGGDEGKAESATELIDDAQQTVDQANKAKQNAEQLIPNSN